MSNDCFKMSDEVLKGCKKYIVERVINPSEYWMSEYEKGKCCNKVMANFENLLAKDVETFPDTEKVEIGEIVAIKDERGFHRGLVTDVFNRNSKTTYLILLVDYGNVVETKQRNIYVIKNKDLRSKKLGAFEVSIHGIKPAVVELECNNNFSGGIFQKRISGNWSPNAFQFVRDLIKRNPCVFVKSIYNNKRHISGEIYFVEGPEQVPVSLGEKLCAQGLAVYCEATRKLMICSDSDIDEKIPDGALFKEIKESEVLKKLRLENKERNKINHLHNLADDSISPIQHILCRLENKSSSLSYTNSDSQSCGDTSVSSCSNNYSSSWILKKCHNSGLIPPPPCDS